MLVLILHLDLSFNNIVQIGVGPVRNNSGTFLRIAITFLNPNESKVMKLKLVKVNEVKVGRDVLTSKTIITLLAFDLSNYYPFTFSRIQQIR